MTDVTTSVSSSGHVHVIEFSNGAHNFFDVDTLRLIVDAMTSASADPSCRVAVLCSAGRNFCAGADFSNSPADAQTRAEGARTVYREALKLFDVPIPIVAAVQGAAVGGGLGLACAADFRIASTESQFHANFTELGFHHGFALTASLPRIVGEQNALRMLVMADRVRGMEASAMGLVDQLTAPGDERATAVRFAERLAERAPLAVRAVRSTLRRDLREAVARAVEGEVREQAALWATADSVEGVRAIGERRPPRFEGR